MDIDPQQVQPSYPQPEQQPTTENNGFIEENNGSNPESSNAQSII